MGCREAIGQADGLVKIRKPGLFMGMLIDVVLGEGDLSSFYRIGPIVLAVIWVVGIGVLLRPCRSRCKSSAGPSGTGSTRFCNYHLVRVSNGPTEALNNLVKRIKRIGFEFRNFQKYRIRALLYVGRLNWQVLGSISSDDGRDPARIRRALCSPERTTGLEPATLTLAR